VTFGRWLLGVVLLAAIALALTLGARAVRRRFVPELDGPTAVLADAILAVSGLIVLAEVLGVIGILDAVPLVVGAIGLGAGGVAVGRSGEAASGGDAADRGGVGRRGRGASGGDAAEGRGVGRRDVAAVGRSGSVATWVAFAGAALVFAAWARRTLVSLDFGIGGVDSLWYHLPFAAQFAREGSVASIPYVDLEFLTAFYPANVELLHAVGMVLFGTAALSPLLNLGALGLGLLAGWCAGRPSGHAPATLLATAVVLGVPALFATQAGEAKNDVFALAALLAAAAFLTATTKPRPATLALAGAAAGLALGTKLSFLAPVGALFLAATWLARRRGAAAFAAAAAITGGYWYLRNLIATGNPLPWLGPLPQPAEARSQDTATALSDYVTDGHAWSTYFLPKLDDVLGPAWPVIVAASAAGAILAIVRGRGAIRVLGIVALVAAAAYVVTPTSAAGPPGRPVGFSLNVRYAIPALLLGLALLPIVLRRWSLAVTAGLAILLVVSQLGPDVIWASDHRKKAIALLLASGPAALLLTRAPRAVAVALAVVAALALWPLERDFLRQQYTATLQPYTSWRAFSMGPVYTWARDQHGARIAVTGTTGSFLQFPLNGPALDNEVELMGRHGAHGSFVPPDCATLDRELRGRTHAVITPYLDVWDPFHPGEEPELACMRRRGDEEILTSGGVHVFALRP
jgi:hypothetical protein